MPRSLRSLRSLLAIVLSLAVLSAAVAWQSSGGKTEPPSEKLAAVQTTGPTYWKGNLHTHSLWSDGDDFPEMIADWYKSHDYNFLALTEHNVIAEGERWVDAALDETIRGQALKKYLARFGKSWVEQREADAKSQARLKPLREFRSLLDEPGRFMLIPGEEISHRY